MNEPSSWLSATSDVHWFTKPRRDSGSQHVNQFDGGVLNLCFNAVDRHVALGRADQLAVVAPAWAGTRANAEHGIVELTYARLLERVAAFAGVLRALGAAAPARVLISLPSGVESVIALLGCWRLGCPATLHSPADGAPRPQLIAAERPLVAVTTSGQRADLQAAFDAAGHHPARTLVVREAGSPAVDERDLDLGLVLRSTAIQPTECVALAADTPVDPTVAGTATVAELTVALRWAASAVLGMQPGDALVVAGGLDPVAEPAACILAPLLIGGTLDWTRQRTAAGRGSAEPSAAAAGVSAESPALNAPHVLLTGDGSVPAGMQGVARSVFTTSGSPTADRTADPWVPPSDWPRTGGLLDRPGVRWASPAS